MTEPLAIAHRAIDALNRGDWLRVAQATDEEDLDRWYRAFVDFQEPEMPPLTAAEIKRYQPELPDVVAEWQAESANRSREAVRGKLPGLFAGIETRAELARLSPVDALARYLEAHDPAWQFPRQLETLRPELLPLAGQNPPSRQRDVIGAVAEGDDVVHVVYRSRFVVSGQGDGGPGELHVASLRRRGSAWRLRMQGELFEPQGGVFVQSVEEASRDGADGQGPEVG